MITIVQPHADDAVCAADDCFRGARRRGLCWSHYQRFLDADPDRPKRIIGDDRRRFWSKVDRSGDCWLWLGGLNGDGYGNFTVAGRSLGAHRVAFEMHAGPVPLGMELDHLCMERRCVRPDHLEVVTHAENVRRAMRRLHPLRESCPSGHDIRPYRGHPRALLYGCKICDNEYHARYKREHRVPAPRPLHCRNGHELTPENIYSAPANPHVRYCRTCKRVGNRERSRRAASRG